MTPTATFLYDRTFDGLLTAVFDAFVRKQLPSAIKGEDEPLPLFHDEVFTVVSDEEKAGRVWRALEKKLSKQALTMLTVSYLAEEEELDMHLFNYICKAVKAEKAVTLMQTKAVIKTSWVSVLGFTEPLAMEATEVMVAILLLQLLAKEV